MVSKCLASFKKSQNKKCHETSATVSLLREVEEVSITMFESLFSSVFPAKETSKQNRWSLVFKSKQSKRVHEVSEGKVEEMQIDIEAIYKQKINMQSDFSRIQGALKALDKNMQQCEEDLECLHRSLIKTRVTILNVLNQ